MPVSIFNQNPTVNKYSKIVYLDVNTAYQINSQPFLVENVLAVINQLYNLFSTAIGERHFEPTFGIELEDLIFDLPNDILQFIGQSLLFDAVKQFQTNVILDLRNSYILPLDLQEGFMIRLQFSIVNINGANNLTSDFYFPSNK